ncbi:MurR/RpiR family transcriptional regulator [Listeria sp. PSOL-1]|uniref:MurR/RpiR family transcriptional regulator n=1 Tax=Listeria sp. PSOL-1 TaxID=1844999 RepID=UPI0013D65829|nr:MurR/RpiR family transcriptional regulator [Listeria sp. PSOL-1]
MQAGSVTSRIQGMIASLPKSEQKIGQVILKDPEWVVCSSIHSLAEKADASGAAVIRFCKSLNFAGFPELKRQLSIELSKPQKLGYYDVKPDDSFTSIKEKLVSNMVQAASDTICLLEEKNLLKACSILEEADTIYVYGVGASWLIAEDFAQKWLRSGKHVLASQDPHVLTMAFSSNNKPSAFLGISYSGETSSVLELTQLAKENSLTTISLTHFGTNRLKNIADLSLETSRAPESELRSTATSSRHAQFLTVDVLYYYYATLHYNEMIHHIQKSRNATDRLREK